MLNRQYGKMLLVGLALLLVVTACGTKAEEAFEGKLASPAQPALEVANIGGRTYDSDAQTNWVDEVQVQERLIIRNADLTIVVDDALETINTIRALVSKLEGWEVTSNVWEYNEIKRGSMTVRVPAEQLDAFLDDLRELANEVTSELISGQDVTEEYVDLQAQLTNLAATRDRVRSFLDEAKDVEEALAVNAELSRLEGEIERITGRVQYLESSARYSSISIEIIPDALNQPVQIGKWRPEGTAKGAIEALISALQFLADALIVIVLFILPLLLVVGLPIYLFVRWTRRRRKKRRAAAAQAQEA